MTTSVESLKMESSPEREELDELRMGIDSIDTLKKTTIAKLANSQEIQVMKSCNILGSDGKVNLIDLAESILDFNYNNSDTTSRKKLFRNRRYVASIQVVLNLFNKECDITGNYDNKTKDGITKLIREYKNNSSFVLESDGTIPLSSKNVIVNALLYPRGDKGKETTDKSKISLDTRAAFHGTYWEPDKGFLTTRKKGGKDYPEWSHSNTVIEW